jgi:hypothetical protein
LIGPARPVIFLKRGLVLHPPAMQSGMLWHPLDDRTGARATATSFTGRYGERKEEVAGNLEALPFARQLEPPLSEQTRRDLIIIL